MTTDAIDIESLINKETILDLVEGVTCEIFRTENAKRFLIAIYDKREKKAASASWLLSERKARRKIADILKQYGN